MKIARSASDFVGMLALVLSANEIGAQGPPVRRAQPANEVPVARALPAEEPGVSPAR